MKVADIDTIVDIKTVQRIVNLSRSTIYRLEKAGSFPKRIRISDSRIGWSVKDISELIERKKRLK